MQEPKKPLQMQGFLSAVNHYQCMWPQRAHILAPRSRESGKKTFCWTHEMNLAFKHMKALMTHKIASLCILTTTNFFISTLMPPVIKWVLTLSKKTNLWPSGHAS